MLRLPPDMPRCCFHDIFADGAFRYAYAADIAAYCLLRCCCRVLFYSYACLRCLIIMLTLFDYLFFAADATLLMPCVA